MRVLVTGANGFVGSALARRLLRETQDTNGHGLTELLLVDQRIDSAPVDPRVRTVVGDLGAPHTLEAALKNPVDLVFHLASVPGALAEAEPALGDHVNLHGMLALFERLTRQGRGGSPVPRVVFASSVAVYGTTLPSQMDEHTVASPTISYGVHKLIGEQVLADWTRQGALDGRSLRLPGIVARPGLSAGHGSAFMSAIFRAAELRQPYTCPVSPHATAWWMSRTCCIDNLLHAARLAPSGLHAERVWTPPVLHLAVQAVVEALTRRFGRSFIEYAPVPTIESLFGRQPPLLDRRASAVGFANDRTVEALVTRALQVDDGTTSDE
ncbi:MAG: D-erythronate dehydrogenase [Paracidovorax wautersii]|uniref:D-erythronate dehydrogenase n=1 Tax=Paracidovorax wautersii TaxID=1177982 RepID=A0A7V8FKJ3_9BURK|nr:MAG: D-erythronate dehydrogenase [Paracidovorax wautersii]